MQFARTGARSSASPRVIAASAPDTPAVTEKCGTGSTSAEPDVQVNDSVTKPFAAYLAASATPGVDQRRADNAEDTTDPSSARRRCTLRRAARCSGTSGAVPQGAHSRPAGRVGGVKWTLVGAHREHQVLDRADLREQRLEAVLRRDVDDKALNVLASTETLRGRSELG
jgi:hypothetical protein